MIMNTGVAKKTNSTVNKVNIFPGQFHAIILATVKFPGISRFAEKWSHFSWLVRTLLSLLQSLKVRKQLCNLTTDLTSWLSKDTSS